MKSTLIILLVIALVAIVFAVPAPVVNDNGN